MSKKSGSVCSVPTCSNYFGKTGKTVSYFHIPKQPDIRKEWIRAIKPKDSFRPEHARICSAHFRDTDFARDLQAELLGYTPRRKLKEGCIPSLNLPGSCTSMPIILSVSSVTEKSLQTATINPTPSNNTISDSDTCNFVLHTHVNPPVEKNRVSVPLLLLQACPEKKTVDVGSNTELAETDCLNCSTTKRQIISASAKFRRILVRSKTTEHRFSVMREKICALQKENKKLEDQLKKKDDNITKRVQKEMERVCAGILTKTQIQCLIKGKKKGRWTEEDITRSLALRAVSRRAYNHRRKLGEPLPGLSTLRRWIKLSESKQDIVEPVQDDKSLCLEYVVV